MKFNCVIHCGALLESQLTLLRAAVLLLSEQALRAGSPWNVLWTGPAILLSSVMIAWGAEAAQYFMAQGIALAILAVLQTLPEFAVEAVLAWHQQTEYLFANLTGALRLLTGVGWPIIYMAAASAHRRELRRPMRVIQLTAHQSIQVVGLFFSLIWQVVVWFKGSLGVIDGAVLLAVYVGYLLIMRKLPPEEPEGLEHMDIIPRKIVSAPRGLRIIAILGLFAIGGIGVFAVATPFLEGLFGLSTSAGIPAFIFIAWVAPLVSEAPEGISAFYWARDYPRANTALMNLVSSNISQWTLMAAMLPVVLSVSVGHPAAIPIDALQSRELLMTLAQALVGALLLLDLRLERWEAIALFALWAVQIVFSITRPDSVIHWWITGIYFVWAAAELIRFAVGARKPLALTHFRKLILTP
jgi:cation:H+ antiporter